MKDFGQVRKQSDNMTLPPLSTCSYDDYLRAIKITKLA